MLHSSLPWLLLCGGLLLPAAAAARQLESMDKNGLSVAFEITPVDAAAGASGPLRAGEHVSVRFRIEDANRQPLTGLYPAAWIHPASPEDDGAEDICVNKAKAFIGGSLLSRAELDLNVYYVLTLNQDATISVVDPLFGFGGSKLLTMLPLNGIGHDWAMTTAQDRVFVSLPAADEIAEINTADWSIIPHASGGDWQSPTELSLPAGQPYLWALVDGGVAVFQQQPLRLHQRIALSAMPFALSFSADGRYAYALGPERLSVIDTHALSVVLSIELGDAPVSMDYSGLAEELYVSHAGSGEIWVIDGKRHKVTQIITSEPGIGMLRFSSDGRWGLLVNPATDRLSIIDAARQRIVQSGRVEDRPEYIAFSDNLAYIRHKDSSNLYMITLDDDDLGREGANIPTVDTPGGDHPPGRIDMPSGSDGIVQAPGSNAVLIANYHDKAVYFYKEGMAAPMGQFNNYGKFPRAVLAVDHSLQERHAPGEYTTSTRLPEAGHYQAVYFMDSPRVVHCFAFDIAPNAASLTAGNANPVIITSGQTDVRLTAGQPARLTFRVAPADAGKPLTAARIDTVIVLSSGLWRQRLSPRINDDHEIVLEFVPPLPGTYDVHLAEERFSYVATP